MAPFGGEPCVIEIEPANQCADIDCGRDRIELVVGAWNTAAVGNDRVGHNWTEQFYAGRIIERERYAPKRIHQAIASGLVSLDAVDFGGDGVIGDFPEEWVKGGAEVEIGRMHSDRTPSS